MTTLLSATPFAKLVGIAPRRFDQRRARQPDLLPITASEPGRHGRFDAFDALKLRATIALEAAGLEFSRAAEHVRRGAISPAVLFDSGEDVHLAIWSEPKGSVRRLSGTLREISRALPAEPVAVLSVNLSAIRDEVAQRATAQLRLTIRGGQFQSDAVK